MKGKRPNLAMVAEMLADENKAREWLESKVWPHGPVCPHDGCGCMDSYNLAKTRPGLYKCKACGKQFTVRIGTIMEESKVQLRKWLMAIHLMTSSKKGVSSYQIARECGITQKSAWFVNHRIREAMKHEPMASMLKGKVEVDETYVRLSALKNEFTELADQWRQNVGPTSSAAQMAKDPAYQKIISMGFAVVPYILAELEKEPDHWFIALYEITGDDPVLKSHRGDIEKMAEDWIAWGRKKCRFIRVCSG
jgi:transposase-like protein